MSLALYRIIYLTRNDALAKNMVKCSGALNVMKFLSTSAWMRKKLTNERGNRVKLTQRANMQKFNPIFQHIHLQIKVGAANQIWSFFSHKNKQLLCHSRASLSGACKASAVDREIFVTSFMTAGFRIRIFASINRQTCGRVPTKFLICFWSLFCEFALILWI